ncbi:MAG: hypothetical protein K9I85_05040 [Saprospiraceae bacterium]|nr:hypothetical protein [Saprospiraceae bacterium]
MNWKLDKLLAFVILSTILPGIAFAQPKDNSPITRYGIGDVFRGDFNQTGATGGLFAAWTDPYRVNPGNPASFPYLQTTALEFGLASRYNQFESNGSHQAVWSGNLDYLSLAFPLKSRINEILDKKTSPWDYAMGVQISPLSLVGYDVEVYQDIQGIDTVRSIFLGEGGLTQAAWSGGVKYKGLSAGIQLGYVFGRIENNSQLDLIQEVAPYSTRSFSTMNLRGFKWQAGLMYKHFLDPESEEQDKARFRRSMTFGLYGGSATNFNTFSDRLIERINIPYTSSSLLARDTILLEENKKGSGQLPAKLGLGMTYSKGSRYQIGINAEFNFWNAFKLEDKTDIGLDYQNSMRLSAGGEWTPDVNSFRNYLRRVRYRAGIYYETDPRVINGQDFAAYGLQIGFGFPVLLPRQQISFLDLALEAGRRGVTEIQQDTYFRIRIAATLNDNSWFYKRKFD